MNVERERNRLRYVLCLFCVLCLSGVVKGGVMEFGMKMGMGKDGLLIRI